MSQFEKNLAERIRNDDSEAFKRLFELYYVKLCQFACRYVHSHDLSRDVVQEVFIKIWDNRRELHIKKSLRAYLYQAVRNNAINHANSIRNQSELKAKLINSMDQPSLISHQAEDGDSGEDANELHRKIWKIAAKLPEKRRYVFILHRKHGLSYREISEVLNVTRKTVENQMGRALSFIRRELLI